MSEFDPRSRVVELPCWQEKVEPEPLEGGITNINYTVEHRGEKYFVRVGEDIPVHNILRFNERLGDFADAPESRAELRLESARICIDKLNAPTEGIEHLNAVLDEVPSHAGAVELLAGLLEKEGRDDELADLYSRQIDLAAEAGDEPKQLLYRVKQAELYETRLNDVERAIEGYQAVLEADDSFRPALAAVARLYEQQGEQESAAEAYEKLLHHDINKADEEGGAERVRLADKTRELYVALEKPEQAASALKGTLTACDVF